MRWSTADIADAVTMGLQQRAEEDDASQVVYGFDALAELGLHPIIRSAREAAGFGAWPEQRYPGHWHKKSRAQGDRCDIVLTPDGTPLRDPAIRHTLFDAAPATDAEAAYWLEIKTVAQFEIDGPFRRYSAELFQPVTKDVKKIFRDDVIKYGGLLLILFTASEEVARHDLVVWHERCLQKGYPAGPPAIRGFPITDRLGNAWCSVSVFGVRGV